MSILLSSPLINIMPLMNKMIFKTLAVFLTILLLSACTFAGTDPNEMPGFFIGIWHGILAPFTLIVRFFIEIKMYAVNNTGFGYDLGFILGLVGAIPLGWLATLISIGFYYLA